MMELAAGALTFGTVVAQLAVVTIKLKHTWDDITEIPDKLRQLLADIEHIRLLFAEMEASLQDPAYPCLPLSFWTGPLMQHSLGRSKRALMALETAAEDLNAQLKAKRSVLGRKVVAIRGFMDKERFQKLELGLTRSIDLLWKCYDL